MCISSQDQWLLSFQQEASSEAYILNVFGAPFIKSLPEYPPWRGRGAILIPFGYIDLPKSTLIAIPGYSLNLVAPAYVLPVFVYDSCEW